MYEYGSFDRTIVRDRVRQFEDQVGRRLTGALSEDEFRPLRLMNGLYQELHAYMLRIAIPYGTLSSNQLRRLAHVTRTYDRGYGHFTTRQNLQINWLNLKDVPDLLRSLAEVDMHAIQTSGNCIRNVTADTYAGAVADEVTDSRIWAEIVRQWSTLHPEFSFLPRKFKIAVSASPFDRAAVRFHDIGLIAKKGDDGDLVFEVLAGGGQGRTPMIAKTLNDAVPAEDLLSYLEAIMRVYNLAGRRDNKYKARIKILVHDLGVDEMVRRVETEWAVMRDGALKLPEERIKEIETHFAPPPFETLPDDPFAASIGAAAEPGFAAWIRTNTVAHKQPGYAIVILPLKEPGAVPGDLSADAMEAVADLAETYSFDEIRVRPDQNLVLPHVQWSELRELWAELKDLGLATSNAGLIGDMVACPGLDYCSLANARSIPVAQRISRRFADLDRQLEIGRMRVKLSGCINACGHHHVADIGVLGVERAGREAYQVTLGGNAGNDAAIGDIVGPAFDANTVVDAVEAVIAVYLELRETGEAFAETYRRLGPQPFKQALYPEKYHAAA